MWPMNDLQRSHIMNLLLEIYSVHDEDMDFKLKQGIFLFCVFVGKK